MLLVMVLDLWFKCFWIIFIGILFFRSKVVCVCFSLWIFNLFFLLSNFLVIYIIVLCVVECGKWFIKFIVKYVIIGIIIEVWINYFIIIL